MLTPPPAAVACVKKIVDDLKASDPEWASKLCTEFALALDAAAARVWEEAASALDRSVAAAARMPAATSDLSVEIMQAVRIACTEVLTGIAADFRARAAEARR